MYFIDKAQNYNILMYFIDKAENYKSLHFIRVVLYKITKGNIHNDIESMARDFKRTWEVGVMHVDSRRCVESTLWTVRLW